MGQITGYGDMIRALALQVFQQEGKDLFLVRFLSAQSPFQLTQESLVEKIAFFNGAYDRKMRVGEMGQDEFFSCGGTSPGIVAVSARRPVIGRNQCHAAHIQNSGFFVKVFYELTGSGIFC